MSGTFRSRLVKWLPAVVLGSLLVFGALVGAEPTIAALFVVALVQGLWIAVPKAARGLGSFVAERKGE